MLSLHLLALLVSASPLAAGAQNAAPMPQTSGPPELACASKRGEPSLVQLYAGVSQVFGQYGDQWECGAVGTGT